MRKWIYMFMAAGLLLSACVKENRSGSAEGTPVLFSASTVETRTTYSGKVTDGYEWIDWSANDQIKINCPQTTPTSATYKIGSGTASGKQSQATGITCISSDQLQWGSGTHRFFAVYPSSADLSVSGTDNSTTGTMSGTILASQDGSPALSSYGYMYASATESIPGMYQSVNLAFRPLFNAIRFSLKAADSEMAKQLSSIVLSSSDYLAGSFSATWSAGATDPSVTPTTDLSTSVTIDTDATLSTSTALSVTFFTLPIEQKNLTLKLNFNDNTSRTLELKNSGGTKFTLNRFEKLVFSDISVPPPDPGYYTITFNDVSATNISSSTTATSVIDQGLDRVTSEPFSISGFWTSPSAPTMYPWKVSSCSLYAPGYQLDETITIALSDAGQKLVSSIELDVSDTGSVLSSFFQVNGTQYGGDLTLLPGSGRIQFPVTGNITSIQILCRGNLTNLKINSITVYY